MQTERDVPHAPEAEQVQARQLGEKYTGKNSAEDRIVCQLGDCWCGRTHLCRPVLQSGFVTNGISLLPAGGLVCGSGTGLPRAAVG